MFVFAFPTDPDRLRRPGARTSADATCEDDPMVKEMGYSCALLKTVAEEHEGCETRLVDLKPDQTLPPDVPLETRVKDACPRTCDACDGQSLVKVSFLEAPKTPLHACEDCCSV